MNQETKIRIKKLTSQKLDIIIDMKNIIYTVMKQIKSDLLYINNKTID